jgi:hypothetical protein
MNIEHRTLNVQHRIMYSARREPQGRTARRRLRISILRSLDHVFSVINCSGQAEFHTRVQGIRLGAGSLGQGVKTEWSGAIGYDTECKA